MGYRSGPSAAGPVWRLAARQHGVISHKQLRELGYSAQSIKYRITRGRLHCLFRGVYAVGRPELTQHGWWMAAALACGEGAVISHVDAAALWGFRPKRGGSIHVSVPRSLRSRPSGLVVHRRSTLAARELTRRRGIAVTRPAATIVDIAATEPEQRLERAINEADQQGVIRFGVLLRELERTPRRPGLGRVKRLVLRHSFRLTRSELERLFLPITQSAGLSVPETRAIVNGVEVDFFWPDLGLVVEADSLTYHRTPVKQTRDVARDHKHFANDIVPLRFTHWQIARQPEYVEAILRAVATRLAEKGRRPLLRHSPH